MDRSEGGIRGVEPSPTQEPQGIAQPLTLQKMMVALRSPMLAPSYAFTSQLAGALGINNGPTLLRAVQGSLDDAIAVVNAAVPGAWWQVSSQWQGECKAFIHSVSRLTHRRGLTTSAALLTALVAHVTDGSVSDRVTEGEDLGTGRRDTNNTSLHSEEKEETR